VKNKTAEGDSHLIASHLLGALSTENVEESP